MTTHDDSDSVFKSAIRRIHESTGGDELLQTMDPIMTALIYLAAAVDELRKISVPTLGGEQEDEQTRWRRIASAQEAEIAHLHRMARERQELMVKVATQDREIYLLRTARDRLREIVVAQADEPDAPSC